MKTHTLKSIQKYISGFVAFAFLLVTLSEGGSLAYGMGAGSNASSGGNQSAQLSQITSSSGAVQSFQADLFTGESADGDRDLCASG